MLFHRCIHSLQSIVEDLALRLMLQHLAGLECMPRHRAMIRTQPHMLCTMWIAQHLGTARQRILCSFLVLARCCKTQVRRVCVVLVFVEVVVGVEKRKLLTGIGKQCYATVQWFLYLLSKSQLSNSSRLNSLIHRHSGPRGRLCNRLHCHVETTISLDPITFFPIRIFRNLFHRHERWHSCRHRPSTFHLHTPCNRLLPTSIPCRCTFQQRI